MIRSLSDEREQLWANERAWNLLFEAQHNGRISAQENVEVWNELRESLGLTEAEMAATFNDKYLAWSAEQADNLREAQEQADAFAANIADARNILASADWGRADLEGAAAAYETYRQAVSGDRQQVADSEAAWDSFGDAVEGAGGKLLDLSTPEGRQVYAALDELATSIMPDLAQAFADSDGDIGRFRRSADILANQTLRRLQNEFNLSEEEAATLFAELGLLPEQITTFYELAGDEAARQKLGLLQGVIDGLPEDVQTEVAMHILADDPQAALAAVQRAIDQGGPLEADLTLDISQAVAAIARLRDALRGAQILAGALGINVQSSAASTAAAPAALMAAPATTAAPASAAVGVGGGGLTVVSAPPRPINVTVQAAVIGNRYDVQRAVTRAMRDADRIGQHA
jgi:hypothetical protein